jgi:hypothetical protein
MTITTFAVFMHRLVACAAKIWHTIEALNDLKTDIFTPEFHVEEYLRELKYHDGASSFIKFYIVSLQLSNQTAIVWKRRTHWYSLVLLARVICFIVALFGVNSQSVSIIEALAQCSPTNWSKGCPSRSALPLWAGCFIFGRTSITGC